MQLDLTPELETALLVDPSATGLTPSEIALRAIAYYTQRLSHAGEIQGDRTPSTNNVPEIDSTSPEVLAQRRQIVDAWVFRMSQPDAPTLNLARGTRIRQWMHEDHRYKD